MVTTDDRSDVSRDSGDLPWLAHIFDAQTRHALAEEDRAAGMQVCVLLLAIVSCGLLLGIIAVSFATLVR